MQSAISWSKHLANSVWMNATDEEGERLSAVASQSLVLPSSSSTGLCKMVLNMILRAGD